MTVFLRWFNGNSKSYRYFLCSGGITPDTELIIALTKYVKDSVETKFLQQCMKEFYFNIFDLPPGMDIKKEDIHNRCFSIQKTFDGWNINMWFGTQDPVASLLDRFKGKIKMFTTPSSEPPMDKKFILSIPTYGWYLPNTIHGIDMEDIMLIMLIHYLKVCSKEEHELMLKGDHYWRLQMFRDRPDSTSYCYAYLRPIGEALPEQQKDLKSCPTGYLPAEITSQRGNFIWIKRSSWEKKQIKFEEL